MPAQSQAQQKAAGAALAAKRGDTEVNELQGASRSMYDNMTERELAEMANVEDYDDLPARKGDGQ